MNSLAFLCVLTTALSLPIFGSLTNLNRHSSSTLLSDSPSLPSDSAGLFFGQLNQSLEFQLVKNYMELVKQSMLNTLSEIQAEEAAEKAQQMEDDKLTEAMAGLLQEPDYEYVNVYDCSMWQINHPSDISAAKYGCWYEASVMYVLYLGYTSTANVSWTLDNMDTYQPLYEAYTRRMQNSMFSEWGRWYHGDASGGNSGRANYTCAYQDDNNNWRTGYISNCEVPAQMFAGDEVIDSKLDFTITNAYFGADKVDDVCASMSAHWNMNFDPTYLSPITYTTDMEANAGDFSYLYNMQNTSAPNVTSLFPNPMSYITNDNISEIQGLINFFNNHLFHAPGCDLFDLSSTIQVFARASDSLTIISIEGKEEVDFEEKEENLMILNLVLGIVGLLSIFVTPELTAILDFTTVAAGFVGTFAIQGHLSTADIISNMFAAFSGCVRGVAKGLEAAEIINNFKFIRTLASHSSLMKNFSHYTDTMNELFGLVYTNQT